MPRFYINYRNRDRGTQAEMVARDEVGIEVSGIEQARAAALVSAREMLADDVRFDSPHPMESVFITDETGQEVMTIAAVDVMPKTAR